MCPSDIPKFDRKAIRDSVVGQSSKYLLAVSFDIQ